MNLYKHEGKALFRGIDGAMSAILLEIGFAPGQMRDIFAPARLPGLIVHAVEQAEAPGNPLRLSGDEIAYEGP